MNIPQEIQTFETIGAEKEKSLNIPDEDHYYKFNSNCLDRDDISPHYNDGIVDLEESIGNLRKLLQIKQKSCEISYEAEETNVNNVRYDSKFISA